MASVQNSGSSTAAGGTAVPTVTAGVTPGATTQVTTAAGVTGETTDVFTQLIAGMINASCAPAEPSSLPALQDMTTLEPGTDVTESSADDRDGEEGSEGEDGALAIAALLPGFACLAPPAPTTAGNTSTTRTETATNAVEGALLARRADVDVSQAAVEELSNDKADAANNKPADSSAPAAASTQNPAPSTQIHALIATHAAHAGHDPDVTPDPTLRSPLGTPAWKDELGTQLTWMATKGLESASLRLSPEHLGPLDIRISVREGEASVYFGATHPDTRSALEQSLPRLRELFAAQGLVLADAGVSRDAPRNAFKPPASSLGPRGVSDVPGETVVKSVTHARLGLVDTYV